MSGRASAHARRSHASRSRGPGSSPGCSRRHSASYRSMLRRICAVRALNAPTYGASSLDLAGLGVEGEPVCGEDRPELRVGGDRGVPDAVDRLDHVPHPDRVQAPPRAGREDAGVDLEVQVPVRVAGPRRVVPDHRGLDLLDRHLHLPPARPDPGGRVLGDPADDLGGGLVLRRVQRGRDLRVQRGGQRPGLRAVDGDLDEPQRVRVLADPTLRCDRCRRRPRRPTARRSRRPSSRLLDAVRGRGESRRRRRCPRRGSSRRPASDRARRRRARPSLRRGRTSPRHAPGPPPPRRPSTTNGPLEMPRGPPDHGRPIYEPS